MQVNSVYNNSISNIKSIVVGIYRPNPEETQQHIGLIYFDGEKQSILHQRWHCLPLKDNVDEKYLWLDISLDDINKLHLAAFCEAIHQKNPEGIPYGIGVDGFFSSEGKFESNEDYAGFTCATFVMQVFHSQGFKIIDLDKWKPRKTDKNWQMYILLKLEKWAKDNNIFEKIKDHISFQRKKAEAKIARFKPEEVAVAAYLPSPPHGSDDVKKQASTLLNHLTEHTKRLNKNK